MKTRRNLAILIAAVLCFATFAINSYALPGGSLTMTQQTGVSTILPDTGGIGITIFYVVGITLMIGAVVYFIIKKKKNL